MTADATIRIDLTLQSLHTFPTTIRIPIVWASSPHNNICHDGYPNIAFRPFDLARGPTLWSMYLPGTVAAHLPLSVAPPPSQETHSVFRTGQPRRPPVILLSQP